MRHDTIDELRAGRVPFHQQVMPLRADADIEEGFEVLEILVVGPE